MDAMSFVGRGGCGCALVLLQSVVIISAFPNLLTGDEIGRLVDAGRIKSDDAKRIVEGQTTPEELAMLKVELLKLDGSSKATPAASEQPQQSQRPPPPPGLKFVEPTGCDVNPCRNGGACTMPDSNSQDTTLCICPRGFYGEFCDYDTQECETEPCLHNGECQRDNSRPRGYKCDCAPGYMGDNCEVTFRTESPTTSPPDAQQTSKSIVLIPVTVIIFFCLFFCCLGTAFVATVEADRKVLTERYRVLISVGYRVDYPRIEFYRLAAIRLRFLCCWLCNLLPCCTCGVYPDEDDDSIPLPPMMRGVDPCAQLRSIVQSASMYRVPSQQSQLSLYGRGGVVEGEGVIRTGYP